MKRKISMVAMSLAMAITLNSCGVMFGGSKYEATIVAKNRPNADIYVDGQKIGKGQATTLHKRNKAMTVELKEEGQDLQSQVFDKAFRTGNFILSVVSWGLIGLGVDLGTGAAYKPDHKNNPAIQRVDAKKYTFTIEPTAK